MKENELWREFNLADLNPDSGGGILYASRFSFEKLKAMREPVVAAIKSLGIYLEGTEGLAIEVHLESERDAPSDNQLMPLLEELSVINEALELGQKNPNILPINLTEYITGLTHELCSNELLTLNKPAFYHLATIEAPQIVHDLRTSIAQGYKADKNLLMEIENLELVSDFTKRTLNKRSVIMGGK